MSCKLIITKQGEADLDEIIRYISDDLSAKKAASDFLYKVENCFENITFNPLMFEKCSNDRLSAKGYRKAVINNYVMIYRYDKTENTVYVLRFFYGRRDYINLI